MELTIEKVGDVTVVTVPVEELDAVNAAAFKQAMAAVLEAGAKVVLDLGRVRFIDSSGLGAFLSSHRNANSRGGGLKLCRLSSQVRKVIELVRMQRMLDLFDTREEAVRVFHNPASPAPNHADRELLHLG